MQNSVFLKVLYLSYASRWFGPLYQTHTHTHKCKCLWSSLWECVGGWLPVSSNFQDVNSKWKMCLIYTSTTQQNKRHLHLEQDCLLFGPIPHGWTLCVKMATILVLIKSFTKLAFTFQFQVWCNCGHQHFLYIHDSNTRILEVFQTIIF